jgi:germination protein M
MTRNWKWISMTSVLSTAIALSGCSLFGPEGSKSSQPVDPPQVSHNTPDGQSKAVTSMDTLPGQEGKMDAKNVTESGQKTADTVAAPVYLMDSDGYVVPITMNLPKVEGTAKEMISYMIKGGPVEAVKPQGFQALLPEGTKVIGMTIKDGVATVDFSKEFLNYEAKSEQKIVDALTYSLTTFKSVKAVNIRVNGRQLEAMPKNRTPVTSLNRENGINLELAEGVKVGNTTPVTLYFQAQTADNTSYFVPVTRLINHTDNKALATVEQLIKGPKEGTNLNSSLLPTTKILDVKVGKNLATVNFDENILSYNDGKANPLALESVLLSLTDNLSVSQVQFMVNGKKNVVAGDKDFSKPVTRPTELNPAKL